MTNIASPKLWPELPALADWQETADAVHRHEDHRGAALLACNA